MWDPLFAGLGLDKVEQHKKESKDSTTLTANSNSSCNNKINATQPQVTAQTEHASPSQTDFRQPIGPRIETRQVPFILTCF